MTPRDSTSSLADGFPYLVADVDGAVVGYAYAGPYRARPAYRFTVENSVYVAHDSAPARHRQARCCRR